MQRDIENLTPAEQAELYALPETQNALEGIANATSETAAAASMSDLARTVSLYGKGMLGNS